MRLPRFQPRPSHVAVTLLTLALSPHSFARAQAIPAATASGDSLGFRLPTASGTLHYGVSLSETATFGYEGQNANYYSTNISGNVGYLSQSREHPFSLVYSGGYLFGNNGGYSSQYHDLAFSQVLTFGRWTAIVGDSLAYLPQSAAGGLSGIPGLGDANLPPGQPVGYIDQSILSRNVTRVSNIASGSLTRQITAKNGIFTAASFGVDRYLGNGGLGIDDNNYSVSAGLNHRINARTSSGVSYTYGTYSYTGQQIKTSNQTLSFFLSRQLSRRLSASLSAGPQWITANTPLIPTQLSYAASASLNYAGKNTSSSVGFSRGTTTGSGVVTGAISNSLYAGVQRRFTQRFQGAANVFYVRSRSLALISAYPSFDQVVGIVQVNRSISRNFSAYLSYSAEHQLANSLPASSATYSGYAFNGLAQTVGFGITYSPESIHVGHH